MWAQKGEWQVVYCSEGREGGRGVVLAVGRYHRIKVRGFTCGQLFMVG